MTNTCRITNSLSLSNKLFERNKFNIIIISQKFHSNSLQQYPDKLSCQGAVAEISPRGGLLVVFLLQLTKHLSEISPRPRLYNFTCLGIVYKLHSIYLLQIFKSIFGQNFDSIISIKLVDSNIAWNVFRTNLYLFTSTCSTQ